MLPLARHAGFHFGGQTAIPDVTERPGSTVKGPSARPDLAEALRLASTGANMLIQRRSKRETEAALAILLPHLGRPISTWQGDSAPPVDGCATLVVADVDGLTPNQQCRLLHWLDARPRRVQVVATSATPVFPLVQFGLFSEALFYRLNTILIG